MNRSRLKRWAIRLLVALASVVALILFVVLPIRLLFSSRTAISDFGSLDRRRLKKWACPSATPNLLQPMAFRLKAGGIPATLQCPSSSSFTD
jgi:hypothetical protein